MYAASDGRKDILRMLLDAGADTSPADWVSCCISVSVCVCVSHFVCVPVVSYRMVALPCCRLPAMVARI
jgi:hypothetical protein